MVGLLFILIVINFAITITLYIRYAKNNGGIEDIRLEISEMISKFNQDAERNLQLLEDSMQKANNTIKQLEVASKTKISKVTPNISSEKEPLSNEIKKYIPAKLKGKIENSSNNFSDFDYIKESDNPSIIKASNKSETSSIKVKTFIQKAYNTPQTSNSLNQQESQLTMKNDTKVKEDQKNETNNKDKMHQIAKLIGEGKSLEEISNILSISLGEIKLFTSLFRKRLVQ
ncbi:MAG: hypothetical protein OEV44_01625 [Spirochaetota bacterium]|nr:hypothetical protein [Spirochaetota bacterium]